MKWLYLFLFFPFLSIAQQVEIFYFDFDKSSLNSLEKTRFSEFVKTKDSIIIHSILGFCDSKGNHPYNNTLSEKRAYHLVDILKQNNFIFSDSLQTKGFGKRFEQNQIQSENRKTEVWYSKTEQRKPAEEKEIIKPSLNIVEEEFTEKPTLTELFDNAKKGDIIVIEDIHFFFDSHKIKSESQSILDELFYNLDSYPPLKIEIQAHICCNPDKEGVENLSNKRAKAIYRYLIKSGISKKRLSYSSYGSTKPIYPIPEKNEKEKQSNRRVEILIINK